LLAWSIRGLFRPQLNHISIRRIESDIVLMEYAHCLDYAQSVLSEKPIKDVTYRNYLSVCKSLKLDHIPYPPSAQQLTSLLSTVTNPNSKRAKAIVLKSIFGIKIKVKASQSLHIDLPPFEELHELVSNCRWNMYGLLMLHAGFRLGETLVKQPIKGNYVNVTIQKDAFNCITNSKSQGLVLIPPFLLEQYVSWTPTHHYHSIQLGFQRLFKKAGMEQMTPHKLRHAYATYYADKMSPEALRRQLRHSDIATTMKYYVQVNEKDLLRVMYN